MELESSGIRQGKEYRRILAVGDIHGNFQRLMTLFPKIGFDPEQDLLIFLGDYIDRGDENLHVMEWIMKQVRQKNVIALRGNHEQMLLDYFQQDDRMWRANGGDLTYRELKEREIWDKAIIDRWLVFLEARPCSYRLNVWGQEYFFCHAGVYPGVPLSEQSPEDLLWIRSAFYDHYDGEAIIVAGHTPVSMIEPDCTEPLFRSNHIIMTDTGSFMPKGHISCVDVLTWDFWQSDED